MGPGVAERGPRRSAAQVRPLEERRRAGADASHACRPPGPRQHGGSCFRWDEPDAPAGVLPFKSPGPGHTWQRLVVPACTGPPPALFGGAQQHPAVADSAYCTKQAHQDPAAPCSTIDALRHPQHPLTTVSRSGVAGLLSLLLSTAGREGGLAQPWHAVFRGYSRSPPGTGRGFRLTVWRLHSGVPQALEDAALGGQGVQVWAAGAWDW